MANPATIALTDGTTTYWKVTIGIVDTDGGVSWELDFGPKGYPLPKNTALELVVTDGPAGMQTHATATGYVRGRA